MKWYCRQIHTRTHAHTESLGILLLDIQYKGQTTATAMVMMTNNNIINNSRPSSVGFLLFFGGFLISLRFLVEASWVDPDTPIKSRITESLLRDDSRQFKLVFSDEFEQDGRNFHDGNDPRWTALHKNDCELLQ